jgi:CheY-like chemotaxis protein
VVLLDIEMPVMDGLQAGAAIRKALAGRPPVLIAMSGDPFWLSRAVASGCFDHALAKPFEIGVLLTLADAPVPA